MKKGIILILCVAVVTASCLKSENKKTCPYQQSSVIAPAAEQLSLDTYIDTNNIDAVKHPAGFYYKIITPGNGTDSIRLCSQIQLSYKGKLVNDTIFDQSNNVVFVLGAVIDGWKKSIPMIKRGGEINLYIPPSLGYGNTDVTNKNTGKVIIPANSILLFNVKVTDYDAGY